MTQRPLLYTYRRCPFAMRARMALMQAGLAFDAYEITLRNKPPEMLALSPKGTLPVLVLNDGTVIEQSLGIMRWAWEHHDPDGWWTRSQTPTNLALVALNDDAFKQQLDRYKYPEKFGNSDRDFQRDEAMNGLLGLLEQRLSEAAFLGGTNACATDVAIFPFIRQFRAVDPDWFDKQAMSATQLWLQQWLSAELFTNCMKKLPPELRIAF